MWKPDEPYNDLPPPPVDRLETRPVLRAAAEARGALAGLNQAVKRIPNPAILISSIPLLEAKASSEIENIVTTTDELFRHASLKDAAADPAVKETLHYREALFAGLRGIRQRPLSANTAAEVCSSVTGHEMSLRSLPGTFIGNPVTLHPCYTPPEGKELLARKLREWEEVVHAGDELDPLVAMATAHYQFEAIHPFTDGNGRTGRILNILMLVERGLLAEPVLYLSRHIVRNKNQYYDRLLAVTSDGAWEEWLSFMLIAVQSTAEETLSTLDRIQGLRSSIRDQTRSLFRGGLSADFLDALFHQPYCRIADIVRACGVSRPTAAKWLEGLVELGFLRDERIGRERIFVNLQLMDALS
jgi:fic family protein